MNLPQNVIYIADDDADDRYFMRKSLQEIYPSVTIIEAEDGGELLVLLDTWSRQADPPPGKPDPARYEYAQGERAGNADGP